jgi:hypothetical protein
MGNRAYIQIDGRSLQAPIIFYGHWSGTDNLTAVKSVLEKTARIGDTPYLVAQIFYEFAVKLGEYDGSLSFGIESGHLTGSEWGDVPSVLVNADTGEYAIDGQVFSEFVSPVVDRELLWSKTETETASK